MNALLKTTDLSDRGRLERFYALLNQVDLCGELAKRVYHLGQPFFSDSGSTASLKVSPEGRPLFLFNRIFFDSLGSNELSFVLLHEAAHWAFLHHRRRQERLPVVWNVACDIVVNQFLLHNVHFDKISEPNFQKFIRSAITFENLALCPPNRWPSLTAEEVYEVLNKNFQRILKAASRVAACDEHGWALEDGEATLQTEMTEEMANQIQEIFRECASTWGNCSQGELRVIGTVIEPIRMNWDLILSRRIASCLTFAFEQRWAPPSRKVAWLYPEVLLPADHEMEKLKSSILLAIDASGSISNSILTRLLGVARSVPQDRVEMRAISFDNSAYPLDIWAQKLHTLGGGGTSFDAIEQFAARLARYPDLVVVLTDGFAPPPKVLHPGRWFWLVTRSGTPSNIQGIGEWHIIQELMDPSDPPDIPF